MPKVADLEIGLHHYNVDQGRVNYAIELRFKLPDSEVESNLGQRAPALAAFDLNALRSKAMLPAEYGQELTRALFQDESMRRKFREYKAAVQAVNIPLRLRLVVGPTAPELHGLRWESLLDPDDQTPLCTSQNLYFSRYLYSTDFRPVSLRSKGALRALAVVANPADLANFGRTEIDVQGEIDQIKSVLKDIRLSALPVSFPNRKAELNDIMRCLREKEYDILYLVCHGLYRENEGETYLLLCDEAGNAVEVAGSDLVTRLKELQQRPRLVVLVACESGGKGDSGSLAALGPRLAEAGIPAVIAMQAKVSYETVEKFMPAFFSELQNSGLVDEAFAAARGLIREQPDHWVPVLFMRLTSGRLWVEPGFGGRKDFDRWPSLISTVRSGRCTPILGHGLIEPLVGSFYDIARRWASTYHYPLSTSDHDSLPQVAQFLTVTQNGPFPYETLGDSIRGELVDRFGGQYALPKDRVPLDTLLADVWRETSKEGVDPHCVLAELPLPIYITTNYDNLLYEAMKAAGRDPQVVLCPWNRYIDVYDSVFEREKDYIPTPERPLIYHLYGRLNMQDSIVLTEDDYFDYLMGFTRNRNEKSIPDCVLRALTDASLLFVGFRLDDWSFRILLRSLLSLEGGRRRMSYDHIAAQIEPEEGLLQEPERARNFMEQYFEKGNINLYWGRASDFLEDLHHNWNKQA